MHARKRAHVVLLLKLGRFSASLWAASSHSYSANSPCRLPSISTSTNICVAQASRASRAVFNHYFSVDSRTSTLPITLTSILNSPFVHTHEERSIILIMAIKSAAQILHNSSVIIFTVWKYPIQDYRVLQTSSQQSVSGCFFDRAS
jgi:hypothetical protein